MWLGIFCRPRWHSDCYFRGWGPSREAAHASGHTEGSLLRALGDHQCQGSVPGATWGPCVQTCLCILGSWGRQGPTFDCLLSLTHPGIWRGSGARGGVGGNLRLEPTWYLSRTTYSYSLLFGFLKAQPVATERDYQQVLDKHQSNHFGFFSHQCSRSAPPFPSIFHQSLINIHWVTLRYLEL